MPWEFTSSDCFVSSFLPPLFLHLLSHPLALLLPVRTSLYSPDLPKHLAIYIRLATNSEICLLCLPSTWELVESGSVCREGLTDALERLSNLVRVVPNVQTDPRAQKSVSGMLSPKRAIEASSLPSQPHGPRQKGCGVTVTARSWAGSVQSSIFWT